MTCFLLWLYCVNLLVVHLESRWEKVESVALAAKLVSGWRHWSDDVLISRPQPNGSHSWKQEVCSAGDSPLPSSPLPPSPQARHGPDEPWVAAHTSGLSVTTYCISKRDRERRKARGLLVFMDDLDFSSVVSKFDHVTGKYGTRCAIQETLYVLIQDVIFSHIKSSFFWCEYRNTLSFLFVLWSIACIGNPKGNHTGLVL